MDEAVSRRRCAPARMRMAKPRVKLALALALTFLASFVATAFASQSVWLDWVSTNAGQIQQWSGHHLNYVETDPEYYSYGCANAQIQSVEYFSSWFCSLPGYGVQSTYMSSTYLFAQAWNDSSSTQPLWAWAGYS